MDHPEGAGLQRADRVDFDPRVRLAGYEDVNDANRLACDPVMRQVVGGRAVDAQ